RCWGSGSTRRCCPGPQDLGRPTGSGPNTGTGGSGRRRGSRPSGRQAAPRRRRLTRCRVTRCQPHWVDLPLDASRSTTNSPRPASVRDQPTEGVAMLQAFDERNRDIIVNVGGRLTHRDQAAVSPFDSAVQGGDAVWEGLRLHGGRIFQLDEHLARLRRSAKALAFESVPSDAEIIAEISRTLAANDMYDGVH